MIRLEFLPCILIFLLNILFILLKALRFQAILAVHDLRLSFKEIFPLNTAGMYLGSVTPGRLGDLSRIWLLHRRRDISYRQGTVLVILDRIMDLLVLVGLAGLILYMAPHPLWGVAAFSTGFLILILFSIRLDAIIGFGVHLWERIQKRAYTDLPKITLPWGVLNPRLFRPWVMSVAAGGILVGQILLISQMYGFSIPPLYLAGTLGLASLTGLLPITISGLGTRELVFTQLLGILHVSGPGALSISLSFFVLNNLGILGINAILFYFFSDKLPSIPRTFNTKDYLEI